MRLLPHISLILTIFMLSGCSVFMAAKQPDKKNMEVMRVGSPRALILAEFGLPIASEIRDGNKYEIYKFIDGYSTGAKAGRAVFHGLADVATLGLWEVVGTTTEGTFDGDEMVYQIQYDDKDIAVEVIPIKK